MGSPDLSIGVDWPSLAFAVVLIVAVLGWWFAAHLHSRLRAAEQRIRELEARRG